MWCQIACGAANRQRESESAGAVDDGKAFEEIDGASEDGIGDDGRAQWTRVAAREEFGVEVDAFTLHADEFGFVESSTGSAVRSSSAGCKVG